MKFICLVSYSLLTSTVLPLSIYCNTLFIYSLNIYIHIYPYIYIYVYIMSLARLQTLKNKNLKILYILYSIEHISGQRQLLFTEFYTHYLACITIWVQGKLCTVPRALIFPWFSCCLRSERGPEPHTLHVLIVTSSSLTALVSCLLEKSKGKARALTVYGLKRATKI